MMSGPWRIGGSVDDVDGGDCRHTDKVSVAFQKISVFLFVVFIVYRSSRKGEAS